MVSVDCHQGVCKRKAQTQYITALTPTSLRGMNLCFLLKDPSAFQINL